MRMTHTRHYRALATPRDTATRQMNEWLVCCAVLLLYVLWCAGNPAAERVLDELLMSCCCREERATLLPEAFMPPGLEVRTQHAAPLPTSPPPLSLSEICSNQRTVMALTQLSFA